MSLSAQFLRNLQRFRLVTFDVTDTLLQLRDPAAQYVKTAAELGITHIERQQVQRCFREKFKIMSKKYPNFGRTTPDMSWQAWWLQLVGNVFHCVDASIPDAKLQSIAEQLLIIYRTNACWSHVECAADLVQSVRDAGKCVGVISNFDPSLSQVLSEMGFLDKFDFILTSYEAGVMKPDSGIFEIPVKQLNIAPEQALHIGNQFEIDYKGARKSGWSGLLVQSGVDAKSNGNTCKHSYNSLAEMLQALQTTEIVW